MLQRPPAAIYASKQGAVMTTFVASAACQEGHVFTNRTSLESISIEAPKVSSCFFSEFLLDLPASLAHNWVEQI
jgi:hypothetical protein